MAAPASSGLTIGTHFTPAIERNRDNPDGRSHLCAPPPRAYRPSDTVYCFALGGAT